MENSFQENPLTSRTELQEALKALVSPLKTYFSPGRAWVKLGYTATHYQEKAAQLEGFARQFWGFWSRLGLER